MATTANRTVSIQDIARVAGVSHSTVSRALRDSPLISADVRARIRQIASEMGYTPNAIAQSLQQQRSNSIGLIVASIADPFWADIVTGVETVARDAGLSVFLSTSHRDPEREMTVIETFHRRRVDGILVADSRIGKHYAARIAQVQVPTVLINGQTETPYELLRAVAVDDRAGSQLAVSHLLSLGHRAIAYLGRSNRPLSNDLRLQGYRAALEAAGITPQPHWELDDVVDTSARSGEDDVRFGDAMLDPLLQSGATAVFCYNDMVAIGITLACRARGIRIPEDLSLVGFDDVDAARYVTPTLTTIQQPRVQLGHQAMTMLLQLLEGHTVADVILQPTLIVRESSGAPA